MWRIFCVILIASFAGGCAQPGHQADDATGDFYLVQPGDNLYSIAFELEIDPESLRLANPWLDPTNIASGMRLRVPRGQPIGNPAGNDDNRALTQKRPSDFIWPLLARHQISSSFGYRSGRLHAGIDLRAPRGTAIYASAAGRVVFSGTKRGYGKFIIIDHGAGTETAYGHNNLNLVKKGQRVKQGQVIARVGRSGNATGYHVHFEFRSRGKAVNPVPHLRAPM
jgi:hypothetical protein